MSDSKAWADRLLLKNLFVHVIQPLWAIYPVYTSIWTNSVNTDVSERVVLLAGKRTLLNNVFETLKVMKKAKKKKKSKTFFLYILLFIPFLIWTFLLVKCDPVVIRAWRKCS